MPGNPARTSDRSDQLKVIFVTGSLFYNSRVVERVLQSMPGAVRAVIVGDFIYPKIGLFKSIVRVVQKAGWQYFLFKVFETLATQALVLLKGRKSRFHLIDDMTRLYGVPVLYTKDLNAKRDVDFMRKFDPDVIVSMIPQKIGDEVMSLPKIGVINLHPGLLPEYRCFGGYFWPMVHDFGSYGYTIHFINEKIDAGDLILREAFPITKESTAQNLYYYTLKHGAEGLLKVLADFKAGRVERHPQDAEKFPLRPWPDSAGIKELRKKGYALFRFKDLWNLYKNDL